MRVCDVVNYGELLLVDSFSSPRYFVYLGCSLWWKRFKVLELLSLMSIVSLFISSRY